MKAQDYLPLTETSFFILLSLATSPKHGYAIIKEIEEMSEEKVILATGTLYSAIRRMLDDGWIERVNTRMLHMMITGSESSTSSQILGSRF
jgi:DNA-binding MarR family transcriptional regulator